MSKDVKILVVTLSLAALLLYVTKPKGMGLNVKNLIPAKNTQKPQVAQEDMVKLRENAAIGMQAMKDAIAKKEPQKELDKLRDIIFKEYGVRVMVNKGTGKLRALSAQGAVVAEEA